MKILLIHQYFHEKDVIGGARFNEMAKVWAEDGNEITVLAGMIHYGASKQGKAKKYQGKFCVKERYFDDIEVFRCWVSDSYNKNFLGRLFGYLSFMFSSLMVGLFKTGKYDIILVSSPPIFNGITALILSFFKRIPYLFEIRDMWPESAVVTGVLKNKILIKMSYWLEHVLYKKAILINGVIPTFKEKLVNKGIDGNKFIFIPNGADVKISELVMQNFNEQKFKKENDLENKFILTYVGAHGVANHLIQLIEAAELLKGYKDILFLLIGDGMQKKWLKQEVQSRELSNVRFIDPIPKQELFKYILASDMGISALKKLDLFKAVYSNKTFDYMSCKKPIMMCIDGLSRDLVTDAKCGVYVEPENPKEFSDKVLPFYKDRMMSKELGKNGFFYVKENFERSMLAKKYISELQRALILNTK